MARRTIATVKRPAVHPYAADPAIPDRCQCGLPRSNNVHDLTELPDTPAGVLENEARRLGERPGDD